MSERRQAEPGSPGTESRAAQPKLPSWLHCLFLVCGIHKVRIDVASLLHEFGGESPEREGHVLSQAARKLGFITRLRRIRWKRLDTLPFPAVCRLLTGAWAVVVRYGSVSGQSGSWALVAYADGTERLVSPDRLAEMLEGEVVYLALRERDPDGPTEFNLGWFMGMLKDHKDQVALIMLASLLVNVLALGIPLGFQLVMDDVLVNRAFETLDSVGLGLLLVTLFSMLLTMSRGVLMAHLGAVIEMRMNSKTIRKVLGQHMEYFNARQAGEVVQRLSMLSSVRSFLLQGTVILMVDILFLSVYLLLMVYYSVKLTGVVGVSLAFYVLVAFVMGPVIRGRVKRQLQSQVANHGFAVETVKGAKTLKSAGLEQERVRAWERKAASLAARTRSSANATVCASSMTQSVSQLTTVSLLWLGAREVMANQMSMGALIAFNMMAQRVAQPVLSLSGLWQQYQEFRESLRSLADIMRAPTEDAGGGVEPAAALRGEIEFENVCFRYDEQGGEVLSDVSLRIAAGETVGIVGSSGAGKSTLLDMLLRFYLPTSGRILVDGHNIATLRPVWIRRQSGVLLQSTLLFDLSVRENIALRDEGMTDADVERAARLAGAHDFIMRDLPRGYDTRVGEGGDRLSGGQRQRVGLASALAVDPPLVLLDEPTASLDSESTQDFRERLPEICRGRTVVMATHDLSLLSVCDRILVFDRGRLVEQGSPSELAAAGGRYAELASKFFRTAP